MDNRAVRRSRTEGYLCLVLAILFIVLSVVSTGSIRDFRDALWITVSLVAVAIYAFVTVHGDRTLFASTGRLQLILLVAELLGFGVYLVKSEAIQHQDAAAWLYFCSYVIISALIVFGAFPLCVWLFKRFRYRL